MSEWILVMTSLLWAGNFVAGKFTAGHAPVIVLAELRYGIAVLVMIPYIWIMERRLLPVRQAVPALIGMGVTGVALFTVFMFWALEHTSATNIGLLSTLNPIAIACVSYMLLGEKMSMRQAVGMVVSLGGVLLVITHGEWDRFLGLQFNKGDLLMLAAVAVWGLYTVIAKIAMKYMTPIASALWSGIFGFLLLLPFTGKYITFIEVSPAFWGAILYIGIGATALAMVLWNIGVHRVGGTRAGIFLNLNPIFTAILAYLFLGESMNGAQWIGTVVVIGGMLIFSRNQVRK
ncbi:DMT family transporter [Paenibacillus whitsoniae]|uniref:DMT family transporter n=1 Tax=Paenibacillus whitsoniae TaxID=2496558 RepID=A0A3S0BHF4_9BACL|nr:DMT family transporter [Paenibacillus whitsoniae]RTE04236.1 DMT family transporter [Paenibacillus whitsoniae]